MEPFIRYKIPYNDAVAIIIYISYILLAYLFSIISYKYYEKPMMDIRENKKIHKNT